MILCHRANLIKFAFLFCAKVNFVSSDTEATWTLNQRFPLLSVAPRPPFISPVTAVTRDDLTDVKKFPGKLDHSLKSSAHLHKINIGNIFSGYVH